MSRYAAMFDRFGARGEGALGAFVLLGDPATDGLLDRLPAMGADPDRKDVFLEIDFLNTRRIDPAHLLPIVQAFADAPVPLEHAIDGAGRQLDLLIAQQHMRDLARAPCRVPISHSQDSPGPITRSVSDAAVLLGVLAGRLFLLLHLVSMRTEILKRRAESLSRVRCLPAAAETESGTWCPARAGCRP